MPISPKNQLIGLDIGSHSIKIVEIDDSKKGRVLKNFGIIELPPDAIVEGVFKEIESIGHAIEKLIKNLKIKNRNIATSISGFSVIVKKITVTSKEASELESTIQDEAEQYIPFDISEVNLDYDILSIEPENAPSRMDEEKDGSSADKNMDVMLVAAKKDIIDEYVTLTQVAGLSPMVLDVDAFALQNAFEAGNHEEEGCYAIVNIGAEELGINAIRNGISLFARDSSFGGFQITEAIMSEFDISYKEAEMLKLGGIELGNRKKAFEKIFTTVASEWTLEIKRALDFVMSNYVEENITKIFISGGASKLPGFKEYLQLETEIPVEELNPFENLIIDEKHIDPKYLKEMASQAGVAVGLALRSIGDK